MSTDDPTRPPVPAWFDEDGRLSEELRLALRGEGAEDGAAGPPSGPERAAMLMAGYDIVMTDTLEADLLHDSSVDEAAAVRGDEAGARLLAYAGDELEIEFEVVDGRIVGHVDPPGGGTIHLEQPGRRERMVASTEPDDLGAFEFDLRSPGTFRLRYVDASGRSIATGWLDGPHPTRP